MKCQSCGRTFPSRKGRFCGGCLPTDLPHLVASGWAGMMPNGNLVDRRLHPTAIPLARNDALRIPVPQVQNTPRLMLRRPKGD